MDKPIPIKGWVKGVNTVLPEHSLPIDTLRSGVNVDILDSGKVRLRKGITAVIEETGIRSGISFERAIYFAQAGALKRLNSDGTVTTVKSGLTDRRTAFLILNEILYFSTGVESGLVRNGAYEPWGAPDSMTPPVLATAAGVMASGVYQALATFVLASGEEGGCGRASSITGTGITITAPAAPADVVAVRLYVTPPDGTTFYQVAEVAPGASVTFLTGLPPGPACRTQFLQRPPPGVLLEEYRGQIYAASGNIVWITEPMYPGLCNMAEGFLAFPAPVTILKATLDGIYVASDQIYFLAGTGPSTFELREALTCGAAFDSASELPGDGDILMITHRGMAIAKPSGVIELLQDTTAPSDVFASGATAFRETDGVRQLLGAGKLPQNLSRLVAADFMDAEIIRLGG